MKKSNKATVVITGGILAGSLGLAAAEKDVRQEDPLEKFKPVLTYEDAKKQLDALAIGQQGSVEYGPSSAKIAEAARRSGAGTSALVDKLGKPYRIELTEDGNLKYIWGHGERTLSNDNKASVKHSELQVIASKDGKIISSDFVHTWEGRGIQAVLRYDH